jgi:hypothetical protein
MMRYGTHLEPPARMPGESYESWLEAARTAIVLLPERTSVDPRGETVKEPVVRPGRVCALDGCGIVFNPRAATQQCCSRPHREALARAEGRKSQQQPAEQNRAAWRRRASRSGSRRQKSRASSCRRSASSTNRRCATGSR